MAKNFVPPGLIPIPSVVIDCLLAEMAGLGYCELRHDGTIYSVGAGLMHHFPGKLKDLQGRDWTELRRIHFLKDLEVDLATVTECDWAGFWTGPTAAQDTSKASWMVWRSDRALGHLVIMVRPPVDGRGPGTTRSRGTKNAVAARVTGPNGPTAETRQNTPLSDEK